MFVRLFLGVIPVFEFIYNLIALHSERFPSLGIDGDELLRPHDLTIRVSSVRHRASILSELTSRGIALSPVFSVGDVLEMVVA